LGGSCGSCLWRRSGICCCGTVFVVGRAKGFGKIVDDVVGELAREIGKEAVILGVIVAVGLLVKDDFAVSAENDLSEEADHAGFFEKEAARDAGENRFGKEAVGVFGSFEGAGGFGEFCGDGGLR
jgi:hypothetical protein